MNRLHYIICFSPRFMIQKSVSGTEFLPKKKKKQQTPQKPKPVYDIIWFSQSKQKELKIQLFQISGWAMLLPC